MIATGRATLRVDRPADGAPLANLPVAHAERVAADGAALRAAQPAWEALGFAARARWMGRMRDWLMDNEDRLVSVLQAEAGKVRADASIEIPWVAEIVNRYSQLGPRLLRPRRVKPGMPLLRVKDFTVVRRPFPLVGVIGPWNFPLLLSFGDAVPALMAGAAVLVKPSEHTPLTLREVIRGWNEDVGAPPVIDGVYGAADTGAALIDAVDMVQFTGSVRTGKLVATRAAATLTPVCLELGGKDPLIVLRDADVKRAANAATWGGFANSGQICISTERAYVEEPVYDEFLARVTENVVRLRQTSHGRGEYADVGAIVTPAQLELVDAHVQDALSKGARVLTGGRQPDRPGNWYEPTVLADVDHSMIVMQQETFGPVLPVMKVRSAEEALRLANDSPFGLAASVFAGDVKRGKRLAGRLETGTVNVNDVAVAAFCVDAPMGGWKWSGIGSRNGADGLLKYTRAMTICSPRLPTPSREVVWFPYTRRRQQAVKHLNRLVSGRGLRRRLALGNERRGA